MFLKFLKIKYSKDIFYIFLLFIITIFSFYKIVFYQKIFYGSELVTYHYPYYFYISECLKNRIFPLWSPYIFCGHPILAVGNTGVLYPFNLIFFYFPSLYLFSCITVVHFFLAGLFMYIFLRILRFKYFPSFFSSITFMFCRFFFFYLHAPSYIHSTIWLPIILSFMELYFKKNNFLFLFFAILFLTIQFFGGDASLNLIGLFFIFLYFLFRFFTTSEKLRLTSGYLFLILGSLFLSAIQLLPLYELNRLSFRASAEFKEMVEASLKFRELLSYLFFPTFSIGNISKYKFSFHIDEKFTLFINFSTFFALLSLFIKDRFGKFLWIVNIFSLLCVLGENTPVFKIIWSIPFYSSIRYPIKFIYLYFFTFSILTGISLNYILDLKEDSTLRRKIIKFCWIILFFYLLIFIFAGWFSYSENNYLIEKGYLILIFILISFFSIFLYLKNKISEKNFKYFIFIIFLLSLFFNPSNKLSYYQSKYFFPEYDISEDLFLADKEILKEIPEFINFLKKDKDLYRIYPYEKYLFLSNIFSLYKIQSMFGYSAQEIKDYKDFLKVLQNNRNLFGLLNVKYILLPPHLSLYSPGWKLVYDKEMRVYQNENFLPRVILVPEYKVMKREVILEKLKKEEFNFLKYVILEENPPENFLSAKQVLNFNKVKISKYTPAEVIINCSLKEDGFLFLSDTYYPGWKVYVNGKEDKIYRANYLFRAVYLKKGENKVKFLYAPESFKIGLIISISTFSLLLTILLSKQIRKIRGKFVLLLL
jgi:hypothetical protein